MSLFPITIYLEDICIFFLLLVIVAIAIGILFSVMRGRFFCNWCRPRHGPWHDETERELRELRKEIRELKEKLDKSKQP